jgi:hypothetical protein
LYEDLELKYNQTKTEYLELNKVVSLELDNLDNEKKPIPANLELVRINTNQQNKIIILETDFSNQKENLKILSTEKEKMKELLKESQEEYRNLVSKFELDEEIQERKSAIVELEKEYKKITIENRRIKYLNKDLITGVEKLKEKYDGMKDKIRTLKKSSVRPRKRFTPIKGIKGVWKYFVTRLRGY